MTATVDTLSHVPIQDRPWLTRTEAAAIARVHVKTIYAACNSGALPEHKGIGKHSGRIRRSDLDAWIEHGQVES